MVTAIRPSTIDTSRYSPAAPVNHHAPLEIAEDTYLIRQLTGEGTGAPFMVYVNSLVIGGKEPVIVDTGTVSNRRHWIEDVTSLVDPEAVRFIYVSHDDHDHVGNLLEMLELCPNAELIGTWFQTERLCGDLTLPLNRMRWLNDGDSFEAGGRTFRLVRPPVFDSPTTRGLYDSKTGVYWAVDSFAAPVTQPADFVSEMDPGFYENIVMMGQSLVSPWHAMLDAAKFNAQVDRIAALEPQVIAAAHTPAIVGADVANALRLVRALPSAPVAPLPTQADLEAILAGIGLAA